MEQILGQLRSALCVYVYYAKGGVLPPRIGNTGNTRRIRHINQRLIVLQTPLPSGHTTPTFGNTSVLWCTKHRKNASCCTISG